LAHHQQWIGSHTPGHLDSPELHNPDDFPSLNTKKRNSLLYSWWWAYWCPKHVESIDQHFVAFSWSLSLHNSFILLFDTFLLHVSAFMAFFNCILTLRTWLRS
jgi:hypothetical protein